MKPLNMKPFSIEGSVSADQCALLRHNVEDVALEAVAYPSGVFPMPGVLFYQLKSEGLYVTYMVLCEEVYCYERFDSSWRKMKITHQCLLQAKNLIKRVA